MDKATDLPDDGPDHNPAALVWNHAKRPGVASKLLVKDEEVVG